MSTKKFLCLETSQMSTLNTWPKKGLNCQSKNMSGFFKGIKTVNYAAIKKSILIDTERCTFMLLKRNGSL